jgi:hypothetical protein
MPLLWRQVRRKRGHARPFERRWSIGGIGEKFAADASAGTGSVTVPDIEPIRPTNGDAT